MSPSFVNIAVLLFGFTYQYSKLVLDAGQACPSVSRNYQCPLY